MKNSESWTMEKRRIKDGVYLVVDPGVEEDLLLAKISSALQSEVSALQIWDHFREDQDVMDICEKIAVLARQKEVPVLINNRADVLEQTSLSGIHYDKVPTDLDVFQTRFGRPLITGITCNNDLAEVEWAARQGIDYISFCSIFPSVTSNSCELVDFEVIREARRIFPGAIFLSGGIHPGNIEKLDSLDYNGVAVISGIMSAEHPDVAVKNYLNKLNLP